MLKLVFLFGLLNNTNHRKSIDYRHHQILLETEVKLTFGHSALQLARLNQPTLKPHATKSGLIKPVSLH